MRSQVVGPSTSSMTRAVDAVGVLQPVDRRDVRMIERGEDFRFALKPRQPVGVGCERRWQDFDGDVTLQLRIARAIDLAHTPGPKGGKDFGTGQGVRRGSGPNGCHRVYGQGGAPTALLLSGAVYTPGTIS